MTTHLLKKFLKDLIGAIFITLGTFICSFAPHSAIATETPEATEQIKPRTADTPAVSTTSVVAEMSATELEGPTVADISAATPVTTSKGLPTVADISAATPVTTSKGLPTVADISAATPVTTSQSPPVVPDPPQAPTPVPVTPPNVRRDSSPASAPIPTDASVLKQIESYTNESTGDDTIDQVTNVSQLRD